MIDPQEKNPKGDTASPVFLRRRLSAPETIMRRHMLVQQRTDSHDSELTPSVTESYRWNDETTIGSDLNLNKRKEPLLMRKFTLLRRLLADSKPTLDRNHRLSGSYSEWQYEKSSPGKSTQSLNSTLSSPKRSQNGSRNSSNWNSEGSPVLRRKLRESPNRQLFRSFINNSNMTKMDGGLPKNSEFPSDPHSKPTNTNPNIFTTSYCTQTSTDSLIDIEDQNGNRPNAINEGTQTSNTTNLNVISNVHLSQSTLDAIYKQVMEDVSKHPKPTTILNVHTLQETTIQTEYPQKVGPAPHMTSFFLKPKQLISKSQLSTSQNLVRHTLDNDNTGNEYMKPTEIIQNTPSYSARSGTTLMEVNSLSEYTDKESGEMSLVDSLEDPESPRVTSLHHPVEESSEHDQTMVKTPSEPLAFFIPIEEDAQTVMKSVADHLPDKVRERLSRRQLQLEQKRQSRDGDDQWFHKSDKRSFTILPRLDWNRSKSRTKPVLPRIDPNTTMRSTMKKADRQNKPVLSSCNERIRHTYSMTKTRHRMVKTEKPLSCRKSTDTYIYQKTETANTSTKRIKLLEIMECSDSSTDSSRARKSKIPVLIHPKMPTATPTWRADKAPRSTYVDFGNFHVEEPKVDQLIAKILIEALNTEEMHSSPPQTTKKDMGLAGRTYSNVQKHVSVIPEANGNSTNQNIFIYDTSLDNMADSEHRPRKLYESNEKLPDCYEGKAAVGLIQRGDNLSIPKGWITFYPFRKSVQTFERGPDEGARTEETALKLPQINKLSFQQGKGGVCKQKRHELLAATSPPPIMDLLDVENSQRRLLEKFPEMLSISGSAISPRRKSKPPTNSEKDLTRCMNSN